MTTPTPSDFRALCAELADSLEAWQRGGIPTERLSGAGLVARARAALEAQPEPVGPTVMEIIALRDEFAAVSDVYSTATGGQVKPGLFRVVINTVALDYARAVLARWGRSAIEPIPVSERLPTEADCNAEGRCWMCGKVEGDWRLISTINPGVPQLKYTFSHWLPHWALPIPRSEEK